MTPRLACAATLALVANYISSELEVIDLNRLTVERAPAAAGAPTKTQ